MKPSGSSKISMNAQPKHMDISSSLVPRGEEGNEADEVSEA